MNAASIIIAITKSTSMAGVKSGCVMLEATPAYLWDTLDKIMPSGLNKLKWYSAIYVLQRKDPFSGFTSRLLRSTAETLIAAHLSTDYRAARHVPLCSLSVAIETNVWDFVYYCLKHPEALDESARTAIAEELLSTVMEPDREDRGSRVHLLRLPEPVPPEHLFQPHPGPPEPIQAMYDEVMVGPGELTRPLKDNYDKQVEQYVDTMKMKAWKMCLNRQRENQWTFNDDAFLHGLRREFNHIDKVIAISKRIGPGNCKGLVQYLMKESSPAWVLSQTQEIVFPLIHEIGPQYLAEVMTDMHI